MCKESFCLDDNHSDDNENDGNNAGVEDAKRDADQKGLAARVRPCAEEESMLNPKYM